MEGVISVGPWGGQGGDHWSFKASRGGITNIVIHQSGCINSISFQDANGGFSGTFGGMDPNDRGERKDIEIRWPSEYLTSISGTYGLYKGFLVITSLTLDTNLSMYGPFGSASGESFSIPMEDGVVVGFHGRSGWYLDGLGVHVQPVHSHGSISFGEWGGTGGEFPFNFRAGSWIKEVVVHDGQNIKSISFKDANDREYGPFGGNNPNDIGNNNTIVLDGPSEHLTSISGTYGNYAGMTLITSLSFTTNRTTYGPFGSATGTSFSLGTITGSVINGFHGRAGHYLDAIGFHAKPGHIERVISLGPWGGPGGDPWSYVTNRAINQIIISTDSNVKSIAFIDTTGLASETIGGQHPTDIGEKQIIHINSPSEHLISISGTIGNFAGLEVITSLSFTTNRTRYGPFGRETGTTFSLPISNNIVVGFHGRAGHYLDAIGMFVKSDLTA